MQLAGVLQPLLFCVANQRFQKHAVLLSRLLTRQPIHNVVSAVSPKCQTESTIAVELPDGLRQSFRILGFDRDSCASLFEDSASLTIYPQDDGATTGHELQHFCGNYRFECIRFLKRNQTDVGTAYDRGYSYPRLLRNEPNVVQTFYPSKG